MNLLKYLEHQILKKVIGILGLGKKWNYCGQRLLFNKENDLICEYSYKNDERQIKKDFPKYLKYEIIIIGFWSNEKLFNHINNKFNQNGFYILKKNKDGIYDKICFGLPINYEYFVDGIKSKKIILDSGMYMGNSRNYSHFRSNSIHFNNLIIDEY